MGFAVVPYGTADIVVDFVVLGVVGDVDVYTSKTRVRGGSWTKRSPWNTTKEEGHSDGPSPYPPILGSAFFKRARTFQLDVSYGISIQSKKKTEERRD